MKERPILFSAPMVRAILDGRKTMTRRIVKLNDLTRHKDGDLWYGKRVWSWRVQSGAWTDHTHESLLSLCPHGKPGDRLWVRETFSIDSLGGVMQNGSGEWEYEIKYRAGGSQHIKYAGPSRNDPYIKYYDSQRGDWRPSIFMPRWASRMLLEVTAVRVERVKDISEEDATAEGADAPMLICNAETKVAEPFGYRHSFSVLWDSLNAKRGAGWDANPWVWVIEFKRVKP